MGQLVFQATLGGQVNLVGPNTASTYNINVPAVAGNMVTTGDTGTVTNTMLAGSIANAKLTNSSVTIGSTSVALGATSSTLDAVTIGGTTAAAGTFTTLTGSTSTTTPILKSASSLTFQSNGTTTAMTIDTSQNVLIGTTASTYNFQTKNSVIYDGTSAGISVASGTKYLTLTAQNAGGIYVGARSNDALIFTTNDTERARIDTSGNLLVGGASTDPTLDRVNETGLMGGANAGRIFSRGSGHSMGLNVTTGTQIQWWTDNGSSRVAAGTITSSGSLTAYNVSSDYRLKQNVQPMTNTLSLISQLKPCTYEYIQGNQYSEGFIAHELQEVVPHAVTGKKDAVDADGNPVYQGVDASFLIPHLVAAVQELTAKVTALEAK